MKQIHLGIIGYGIQGSHYVKILCDEKRCPDIQVTAVFEIDENKRKQGMIDHPELAFFDDFEAMAKSGLVDACIVCVPHYFHYDYVKACLDNHLHVMCEKPLAVYSLQARQMIDEAKKHPDLVFGAMFNQRTNHLYRKLKEIIDSKEYGQIRRITWIACNWYRPQAYFDASKWRGTWKGEGGGVLINQAMHQLDLWQWLFGLPDELTAFLDYGSHHNIETEDQAHVFMKYSNGTNGTFITSTCDPVSTNRLEVQFDKAAVLAENDQISLKVLTMEEEEFNIPANAFKKIPSVSKELETDGLNLQHAGVLNNFARKILYDEPFLFEGENGLNSLLLCNAIYLSSFLKQTIPFPFDEALYYKLLNEKIVSCK